MESESDKDSDEVMKQVSETVGDILRNVDQTKDVESDELYTDDSSIDNKKCCGCCKVSKN